MTKSEELLSLELTLANERIDLLESMLREIRSGQFDKRRQETAITKSIDKLLGDEYDSDNNIIDETLKFRL